MKIITAALLLIVGMAFGADSNFITLREVKENTRSDSLNAAKFHHWIDINSSVEIRFHPEAILASDNSASLRSMEQGLALQIDELKTALDAAREIPAKSLEIGNLSAELFSNPSRDIDAGYRTLLSEHAQMGDRIMAALEKIGTPNEKMEEIFALPGLAAYERAGEILAEYIHTAKQNLEQKKAELARDDSVVVRVWCMENSKQGTAQVHVKNYDRLPEGNYKLIDKLSLSRTDEEQKYLEESAKLNQEILKFRQDLQNKDSQLRKALDELMTQAKKDLTNLETLFGTEDLLNLLKDGEAEVRRLPADPAVAKLLSDIETLKTLLKGFADLKNLQKELVGKLELSFSDPLRFFQILENKKQEILRFKTLLESLVSAERLSGLTQAIENLKNNLLKVLETRAEASLAKLKQFSETAFAEWKQKFSNLQEELDCYESLSRAVRQNVEAILNGLGFIKQALKDSNETPAVSSDEIPLNRAQPAILDLTRTSRQEKDSYEMHIEAYQKNNSTLSPLYAETYSFHVEKFGLYRRWLGSLQFTRTEGAKQFVPSTSVGYILHYRYRNGAPLGGNLFNFGAGISSMVAANPNGNIEYGAGAAFTMLSDILQAGYGYNIQQRKGYFFFGVALLDLLKVIPQSQMEK